MLKRIKPYKALPASQTTENIKSIFEDLGFQYDVEYLFHSSFHACHLSLINPQNGTVIFSTNGKGITRDLALASAWGELAERFQDLAFYMILLHSYYLSSTDDGSYKFYPDEKVIEWPNKDTFSSFKNLVNNENNLYSRSLECLPFIKANDNTVHYLPIRILLAIVGSNGMCSGNSSKEALIQGISEIFERYVLKEFYLNPFCPPDIPLVRFKGFDIHTKIIDLIKTNNYQVQIKDCSLGKNYPVIGVLIKNNRNEYAFHLGADPSPVTALERCFTEMYQGGEILFKDINESTENAPCNLNTDFWKLNFSCTISAYAGHWPPNIFNNSFSYNFNGFDHPDSISDDEDLKYLLDLFEKEGKAIYIRDNSFLGQPAYYCYVPGKSEITNIPDESFANTYLEFDSYVPILINLSKSTFAERNLLLKAIKDFANVSPLGGLRLIDYFAFFREHPLIKLSSEEFKDLLIIDDDSLFKKALKKHNIPQCFHCSDCGLSDKCNFPFIKDNWDRVRSKMTLFYGNESQAI